MNKLTRSNSDTDLFVESSLIEVLHLHRERIQDKFIVGKKALKRVAIAKSIQSTKKNADFFKSEMITKNRCKVNKFVCIKYISRKREFSE